MFCVWPKLAPSVYYVALHLTEKSRLYEQRLYSYRRMRALLIHMYVRLKPVAVVQLMWMHVQGGLVTHSHFWLYFIWLSACCLARGAVMLMYVPNSAGHDQSPSFYPVS